MSNITAQQAAEDFAIWAQYIDPDAAFTEEEFNVMSIERREQLAQEVIDSNA